MHAMTMLYAQYYLPSPRWTHGAMRAYVRAAQAAGECVELLIEPSAPRRWPSAQPLVDWTVERGMPPVPLSIQHKSAAEHAERPECICVQKDKRVDGQ